MVPWTVEIGRTCGTARATGNRRTCETPVPNFCAGGGMMQHAFGERARSEGLRRGR